MATRASRRIHILTVLLFIFSLTLYADDKAAAKLAAELDQSLGATYTYLGTIQPRHAREIESSNWSIGAETMDRDFTVYKNWKRYLGPLGAKKARIQSGWAKTEKEVGKYDWAWVDEIVLDMVAQGVEPWVCLCYGNPIYPGGGDTGLGGGLVSSEEALQAWERYVAAFVQRYKQHVDEWELWNEPRTGLGKGTVQYGDFVIRTAETIRKIQPDAEILFAAGGSFHPVFAREVLEHLKTKDKLEFVDAIIYHPYAYNPDGRQEAAMELRRMARSFAPHIDIRQGENGAPSRPGSFGAISKYEWTEEKQAKWATRRLLGDLGRDIPSSYFAICDMRYPDRINFKGLLAINPDKTVHHRKLGYYAVQTITALFDNTVERDQDFQVQLEKTADDSSYAVFGYQGSGGGTIATLWRSSDTPGENTKMEWVKVTIENREFQNPVWIDVVTGRVYEIDPALFDAEGRGTVFSRVALYDSAIVIAERKEIERLVDLAKPSAAEQAADGPLLESVVKIRNNADLGGVKRAVADLGADLEKVLGKAPVLVEQRTNEEVDIVIEVDGALTRPESFQIDVGPKRVRIAGADELGVIYGIYRFSNQFLGVDPYWYFKDLEPQRRQRISLRQGTIRSQVPTFRYRGWFINDEDLLTEWKDDGGKRFIRYPFYSQVVHLDVLDRVFEALLRASGNMIIPASFVDVMNPPEARLVQRAAERGLYVTQHHIEPLGVSHFGFENFWKAKGHDYPFAYGTHPERVRETWRAYAKRWNELAGNRVVWQLGLRGKGDAAIWHSDKTVNRAQAGAMISKAIAEQWEIVKSVDPRPHPPATTTLWLEGSALMSEGSLTFPDAVTVVFADEGESQKLQKDFHDSHRQNDRAYGVYYHIGFWGTGPHLLQGSTPRRICQEFDKIIAKGDTEYAIINVCNVREHVLGVQAATEIMNDYPGWTEVKFWDRFAPDALHAPYQEFLANLFPLNESRIMQDGALFAAARKMIAQYASGKSAQSVLAPDTVTKRNRQLTHAIESFDTLIATYPSDQLTESERAFFDVHFLTQAKMWRELYAFYLALLRTSDQNTRLADAEAALERFLVVRKRAATGKWDGWYRGDKKVNVPKLLEQVRRAREKLSSINSGDGKLRQREGLQVTIVARPPSGKNVILSQPYGCKGPTSIRYYPLEERELKVAHNPTDPNGGRYYKRDRDLGQTFTVPEGGPFRLDAITVRIGPVASGTIDGAIGARVSVQIMAVDGTPKIKNNGTTKKGMTVSKGYPGKPEADDFFVGETYSNLLVATGGAIPDGIKLGERNTMKPTTKTPASLLRWDISATGGVALESGRRYAFLLCFDEPASNRGLPFDNWDYLNAPGATAEQRRVGPYRGGHRLRREGRVELPWTQPEKVFVDDDKTNAHFPERQKRFAMQPGTWGRPDVDTFSDLTFWLEARKE